MSLALNTKHLSSFINEEEYKAIYPQVEAAHNQLEAKNGPGNDFLGWMYLPRDYDKEEFARIKAAAAKIREDSDVLVVAGVPADQITCLGLGNEPTSVRSTNEPENRCTYVVADTTAQAAEFLAVGQAES